VASHEDLISVFSFLNTEENRECKFPAPASRRSLLTRLKGQGSKAIGYKSWQTLMSSRSNGCKYFWVARNIRGELVSICWESSYSHWSKQLMIIQYVFYEHTNSTFSVKTMAYSFYSIIRRWTKNLNII
jgi:hypothetical protein